MITTATKHTQESYRNGVAGYYDKRGVWRVRKRETTTDILNFRVQEAREENDRLRAENAELRHTLLSAAVLRPKLLAQYGAVPECVLDFCNRARAVLAQKWKV